MISRSNIISYLQIFPLYNKSKTESAVGLRELVIYNNSKQTVGRLMPCSGTLQPSNMNYILSYYPPLILEMQNFVSVSVCLLLSHVKTNQRTWTKFGTEIAIFR